MYFPLRKKQKNLMTVMMSEQKEKTVNGRGVFVNIEIRLKWP